MVCFRHNAMWLFAIVVILFASVSVRAAEEVADEPIAEPEESSGVLLSPEKAELPALSDKLGWGNLFVGLSFDQSAISVDSGTGANFVSNMINPGLYAAWDFPLAKKFSLFSTGTLRIVNYGLDVGTETFDSRNPVLWSLSTGPTYQSTDDLRIRADLKIARRPFIRRISLTSLATDAPVVPEFGLGFDYRVYSEEHEPDQIFVHFDYGFLSGASTSNSRASFGTTWIAAVSWDHPFLDLPTSARAYVESVSQGTDLAPHSTWTLGLVFTLKFGLSEVKKP